MDAQDRPAQNPPSRPARRLDPFAVFTPAERAIIRQATEDWAASYFGQVGPLRFDRADAERHVVERHLPQVRHRPLQLVLGAVAAHLDAHPEILTAGPLGDADRADRHRQRLTAADLLTHQAYQALQDHRYAEAMRLLDLGEQQAPEYLPRQRTWNQLRSSVRRRSHGTLTAPSPKSTSAATTAPAANQYLTAAPNADQDPTIADAADRRPAAAPVAPTPAAAVATDRPPDPRVGMYLRWTRLAADPQRRGLWLHQPDRLPERMDLPRATIRFSNLIDQARRDGTAAGRLSWNGVYVSVGRTADPEPRLRIAVGHRDAHVVLPLTEPWPPQASHGELLRRIITFVDAASRRAAALHAGTARTAARTTGPPQAALPHAPQQVAMAHALSQVATSAGRSPLARPPGPLQGAVPRRTIGDTRTGPRR